MRWIFEFTRHFLVLLIAVQTDCRMNGWLGWSGSNGTEVGRKGVMKRQASSGNKAIGGGASSLIGLISALGTPQSRIKDIPGIPHTRFLHLTKPYADGKNCINGQTPLNPTENLIFLTFLDKVARVASAKELGLTLKEYLDEQRKTGFEGTKIVDYREFMAFTEQVSSNCLGKTCFLDFQSATPTCGPWPKYNFPDQTSCINGAKVVHESKLGGYRLAKRLDDIPRSFIVLMRENAKEKQMAERCQSKKCYYDFKRDWFICGQDPNSVNKPSIETLIIILSIILAVTNLWIRNP